MNRAIGKVATAYNTRPREELCGLSPFQAAQLLYTDWNSPAGVVHLAEDIPPDELQDAGILTNTRVLLEAMGRTNGVKATASGNLNRAFVLQMVQSMHCPEGYVAELWRFNKVLNEEDVFPLHVIRIVLAAAGLIRRGKGAFKVTRERENAATDAEAGRLYTSLFRTYFRRFNLGYLDRLPDCPSVQQTIAYSLYVLQKLAGDWYKSEQLAEKLLLPNVAREVPPGPFGNDYVDRIARTRILEPLRQFGLIECTYLEERVPLYHRIDRVHKTPLFDRFITFHLPA